MDSKYHVFKRIDRKYDGAQVLFDVDTMLPDGQFFVIRSSDVFGAQALFGYAHLIQTTLEVDALPNRGVLFSDEERDRLADLADDLMELGLKWNRQDKKVPD